ncbi:hit family protein [Anaeramoeba flamelloides]|uniref:Hit family protein n=1 Tax=Anaeramoeba flamelloides TaxID=1746091 RepID=A0ABQ8YC67_9EUKA|nr:hit family protein [Anaeramoeba flamelloides]
MSENCIFCKIISGDIPSFKVFENDKVFAFLDINPLSKGHTVVIPKTHCERLEDLPEEYSSAIGSALPKIAKAVITGTGALDWNLLQNNGKSAGQEVPHLHFHIIPREKSDGLGYRWKPTKLDMEKGKTLCEEIKQSLEN